MNTRHHLLNAVVLGGAVGVLLMPTPMETPVATAANAVLVAVPVVLGALVPDVDCHVGTHRKTLHNAFIPAGLAVYTVYTGNLAWVWLGVSTHLALDALASKRGIALFYPLTRAEYGFPGGAAGDSRHALPATVAVTGTEILAVMAL